MRLSSSVPPFFADRSIAFDRQSIEACLFGPQPDSGQRIVPSSWRNGKGHMEAR
jgi:hypothetical protein